MSMQSTRAKPFRPDGRENHSSNTQLKMAVIHAGYPEENLTEDQSKMLVAVMETSIDEIVDGFVPRFVKNWPDWGAHVFRCLGPEDKDWLVQNVPKWIPWKGARFGPVIQASQLKKVVTIRVSGDHKPDVIVKRLAKQNASLRVKHWRVIGCARRVKNDSNEPETVVQVIMEKSEIGALKRLDLRPFCGVSRAYCAIFRDKKDKERSLPKPVDNRASTCLEPITIKIE